jgi:N-methylhydantoinase A
MIPDRAVLGGWVTVDRDLALAALERVNASAQEVVDIATSTMSARLMPLAAASGVDISELPIVAYGGAGPTQACLLAQALGVSTVLVPPMPGAMCALGAALADLRVDFVHTVAVACDSAGVEHLSQCASELAAKAEAWLEAQEITPETTSHVYSADMRFRGQSFEVPVAIDDLSLLDEPPLLHHAFCARYEAVYGHVDRLRLSEVVNLRLQLVGHVSHPTPKRVDEGSNGLSVASAIGTYLRAQLEPGVEYRGPAIVVQYDTTIFIPVAATATVDQLGNLEIVL